MPYAALGVGIIGPVIVWYGSQSRLEGILKERDIANQRRLDDLERRCNIAEQFAIPQRIAYLEADKIDIRRWKHNTVDPYIPGAIDALKERVDRHERKLFNGDTSK